MLTYLHFRDRLQALPALRNGEVDFDLLCQDLQKRAKCSDSGAAVHEADFDEVIKRQLVSKKPEEILANDTAMLEASAASELRTHSSASVPSTPAEPTT